MKFKDILEDIDKMPLAEAWAAGTLLLNEGLRLRQRNESYIKALLEGTGAYYYIISDVITVHNCTLPTVSALIDVGFSIVDRVDLETGPRITFGWEDFPDGNIEGVPFWWI